MNRIQLITTVVLAGSLLGGCASQPTVPSSLVEARQQVRALDNEPLVQKAAADEVQTARAELKMAEELFEEGEIELVEHHAYVASQVAQAAQAHADSMRVRNAIEEGDERRAAILIDAREEEAERAQAQAELARTEAEMAREEAETARAAEARARRAAALAHEAAVALADELENLKATQTERGTVFTLSDVLFDTDESELKPGASETLEKVAQFVKERPDQQVTIEGHTDSRGSDAYNEALSERRADAVREALVDLGVDPGRVNVEGRGESYPVATNETPAGRQQNRRVEVIVTDMPAVAGNMEEN